jgi:hypothetical protein
VAKFVSIPTEVEAVQYGGRFDDLQYDLTQLFGPAGRRRVRQLNTYKGDFETQIFVDANNQWLTIEKWEWVIRDEIGFYPCKNEVFQKKYKEVEND